MTSAACNIILGLLLHSVVLLQLLNGVTGNVHVTYAREQTAFNTTFNAFVERYGRNYPYGSPEYEARRKIFERRIQEIGSLNSRPGRLWNAGVNELADWTDDELKQLRGWRGGASPSQGAGLSILQTGGGRKAAFLQQTGKALKESMFWTNLKSVSTVYDQGGCGSCWAISSATVLNAHAEIHTGTLHRFSAQELVSCVENPHHCGGSGGCDGATVELAMDYALQYGLSEESNLYQEADPGTCTRQLQNRLKLLLSGNVLLSREEMAAPGVHLAQSKNTPGRAMGMTGWERLPENKYMPMMRAVSERGPVAISAAAATWSSYFNGIFDHCPRDAVIDHAVVLLGYGKDKALSQKYWLIQNSWGGEWGEHGTIRLLRRDTDSDECGWDNQPEVGTGCDVGPKAVKVCGMCGILYDAVVPHFG